jgi:hypothetical protein
VLSRKRTIVRRRGAESGVPDGTPEGAGSLMEAYMEA